VEKYLDNIAEMLEVDSVSLDDEFQKFDSWDSLTSLSIISVTKTLYGIAITVDDIVKAKTVGNLISFVTAKACEK
jgi:acyl carrier protein